MPGARSLAGLGILGPRCLVGVDMPDLRSLAGDGYTWCQVPSRGR